MNRLHHETDVLIVGGGPVGLALALDLRYRGVRFLVLDASDGGVPHLGASTVGARSMELFRRWGVADAIRASGWPGDHPLDVAWVTSVGGHEIHRVRRGTVDSRPPLPHTPEPEQVCPQHRLTPLLAREVGADPGGPLRLRCRFDGFTQDADAVTASATDLRDGARLTFRARYLVGCDGAESAVRAAAGIAAPARPGTRILRDILFRAPRLRGRLGPRGALVHLLVRPPALRFPVRAVDGRELYRLTVGAECGQQGRAAFGQDAMSLVRTAVGLDTPLELVSEKVWHLTHRVADRFRQGRVLLAGDAARSLPPPGGAGLEAGICDAADLGWKLTAELAGWAGPGLLDTYDTERRPVAGHCAPWRGLRREVPEAVLADSPEGARARAELAGRLERGGAQGEFISPDTVFGVRYDSPVVVPDGPGDFDWRTDAVPGARAPHAWLGAGISTLDLYGLSYRLLLLAGSERRHDYAQLNGFERAFTDRRVPLRMTHCYAPRVAACHRLPYVLVRPDGHVAWRGTRLPPDPGALADTVRGGRR